jgi:transposase
MGKRKAATYSKEFRMSSARLAIYSDQSIVATARDLGLCQTTLYGWIAQYCPKRRQAVEPSGDYGLDEELKRLRKENLRLRMERDILKKAAAYFAKEAV